MGGGSRVHRRPVASLKTARGHRSQARGHARSQEFFVVGAKDFDQEKRQFLEFEGGSR